MLKIIKSNQPIPVKQITVTVYALPGIGKTSLAFSSGALLIDTDKGSYRAANRGDTVQPASWSEIANLTAPDLEGYSAVALDTAGRALDLLSANILENDPKMGRKSGDLSLQGFGALKGSFTSWLKRLHACGKDVILLSHMDEKTEGDIIKERLDIQGGSKAEIYKCSDAIAKLYVDGKDRKLDFSPREGSLGKNPAQFDILTVPNFTVEPQYFAGVLADIKKALNKMSEAQTEAQDELQGWRVLLGACKTAADFNSLLPQLAKLPTGHAVRILAMADATAKGLKFNSAEKEFYAPSVAVQATQPPVTALQPQNAPTGAVERKETVLSATIPPNSVIEGVNMASGEVFLRPIESGLEDFGRPKLDVPVYKVHVGDVEQRNRAKRGQFLLLTCMVPAISENEAVPLICWHKNSLFPYLLKSMDQDCEFGIVIEEKDSETHYVIETIERIGKHVFHDNNPALSAQEVGLK